MSANTETTGGPPKGYVECPKKCGRWTFESMEPPQDECWTCIDPTGKQNTVAHSKDWTPPIAAPAVHVERRKGQRWKSVRRDGGVVIGTLAQHDGHYWDLVDVEANDNLGSDGRAFVDGNWSDPTKTMTLLADAPPEPEAPKQWKEHARCGFPIVSSNREAAVTAVGKHQATCEKCSAQEAPKAAPVLEWSFADKEGREHRFATGDERDAASRAYWSWMYEQTGKPYAGPERLPRPQLAADWVEDCLPTVWR